MTSILIDDASYQQMNSTQTLLSLTLQILAILLAPSGGIVASCHLNMVPSYYLSNAILYRNLKVEAFCEDAGFRRAARKLSILNTSPLTASHQILRDHSRLYGKLVHSRLELTRLSSRVNLSLYERSTSRRFGMCQLRIHSWACECKSTIMRS